MPFPTRMTPEDAKAMMSEGTSRDAEIKASVDEFKGLTLEELEEMAGKHAWATEDLKRGTAEYNAAQAFMRRIEDAIFAITG